MSNEPTLECEASVFIEGDPDILDAAVSPENQTMPGEATCITTKMKNGIKVTVKGKMTLGRLKHTLDDIVKTASLAKGIEESIRSE